jgi:hypothetical protein
MQELRQRRLSDPEEHRHLGPDFDSMSSNEEELECQRDCDFSCDECAGSWVPEPEEDDPLEELARNSKLIFLALVPMLGRQLGSIFIRRSKAPIDALFILSLVLRKCFGDVAY